MYQLLAVFTPEVYLSDSITKITSIYEIVFNKIFVLRVEGKDDLLCTFNIEKKEHSELMPGAISIHRKKETNTLYTINSLNTIIRLHNNGELDTTYKINWSDYTNSLILTTKNKLQVYPVQVHTIISIKNIE